MQRDFIIMIGIVCLSVGPALGVLSPAGPAVRLRTSLGDIDLELYDDLAPLTVANFLNYVTDGDYHGSFVHRSDPGFVIQGGGYTLAGAAIGDVPTDPPIVNEFNPATMSNTRGTIAMARTMVLDSATSQWFINLDDNLFLDNPASPYCVFGQVVAGMEVVDAIAALDVRDKRDVHYALGELPVIDYDGGELTAANVVMLTAAAGMIPGDANFDQVVDGLDYNCWSLHWQQSGHWGGGDFNGDGFVDNLDYSQWSGSYGTATLYRPLPEPAALCVFGAAVPFVLLRRRRQA